MKDRDFKGIWIPKKVWLCKDLTLQEKVFLVEIDSLDNEKGCFAGNGYFADFFDLSKTRVSLVIKSLIEKGYVKRTLNYKKGSQEILNRVLKVCYTPSPRKVNDPPLEKLKDNNTINNKINIYTEFTEEYFLKRWSDARLHYDKMPTHIKKLIPVEKINFTELKKDYNLKEFEKAIQGLFQQETFKTIRLRPTHFLKRENFETYLTCFTTKEKLFENKTYKKPVERI